VSSPEDPDGRAVPRRDPGRYQILGEHGRGGIGRVSRAYDRDLDRDVAIKELIERSDVSEARFLREAMITAKLEHPGIVPVHEAGRWRDGTPFYAMKLVAGRPLRDLIAEKKTVDERVALLHHVIAVADAMAYAHRRHIIHRDLKPGNVIVGDFGETVVIDWGLAKDLSATEAADDGGGEPSPSLSTDDLTKTGSVLGTPAYMAPEQARGEEVDQRVDVFAIGAMLWELCSLQKVPPTQPRQRHALLRRAGIDRDLITILDKALAPAAAARYRDAGELAADLKAFKAGARISARSYSLAATLGRWTRRHRALAISIAAVLAIVAVGGTLYVRNIAAERDRADLSQRGEQRARASAETSLDALTLNHAQLLLATDPTAALDALATYRGGDASRARQIAAEARGRGVALLRAEPHQFNVLWATIVPGPTGEPFGRVVSISSDGTIVRTDRDGRTHVLAKNVSRSGRESYHPKRHLLAYVCDPQDVCLFDVARGIPVATTPAFRSSQAWLVAFSPSGDRLAVLDKVGLITVLDIRDPAHPMIQRSFRIPTAADVYFYDEDTLETSTDEGLMIVPFTGPPSTLPLADLFLIDRDTESHRIVSGSYNGDAIVVEGPAWRVIAHARLCTSFVVNILFIPHRHEIAYACKEGTMGFWSPHTGEITPRIHLADHADSLAVSADGNYVIVSGGKATVAVLDLTTDLVARYQGSEFRTLALMPPTAEAPFVISGDARGAIRVWPLPSRIARVATTIHSAFHTALFTAPSPTVIAASVMKSLTVLSPTTGAHQVGPHESRDMLLVPARDRKSFAAYGFSDLIERWSIDPTGAPSRDQLIHTQHGSVTNLAFLDGSTDFLTVGSDGRLARWTTPAGSAASTPATATAIAQVEQPLDTFAVAASTHAVVIAGRDGGLWQVTTNIPTSPAMRLRARGARVRRMIEAPDGAIVYAGFDNGDVIAIDTRDRQITPILHAASAIREIAITPDSTVLAISTTGGMLHIATRHTPTAVWTWQHHELHTVHHTLTADGLLVAVGNDSTVWLYAVALDRWLCLPIGTDLRKIELDETGDAAVSLDLEGRMVWIDLRAARQRLTATDPPLVTR
jgi:WD40 repeat protein